MGTRSRIGIELSDGSILSVYHHWDGYPEWLGRILNTHYNTKEEVEQLIDGGDMSSCWTTDRWDTKLNEEYGPEYYSQRGEDCPPRYDLNLKTYLDSGEEFAYLFTNDEWVCYDRHQFEFEDDGITQKRPEVVPIPSGALAV